MKLTALLVAFAFTAFAADHPEKWAQPVKDAKIENLHRITPGLYRSAQPDADGFRAAEKLGIRTVINLRDNNDDIEPAKGTRLRLIRLEMSAWDVDEERVARVLALLREKEHGPFLVHCQHGADRTGLMMAMYRIIEQGWKKEDALAELKDGGYGFHSVWRNISKYVGNLTDARIAALRKRVDELAPRN